MKSLRRALVLAAFPLAEVVAQQAAPAPAAVTRPRTAAEDLQLFSQVFNQIRVNHPDSLDSHRLFMAAIQAMVQATDPHSYIIPAARLQPGKQDEYNAGRLHPVPIDFTFVGGSAVVLNVHPGTEARRRDILPGDELIAIDGAPLRAESALELEITLAGPRNSNVTLTLERRQADGSFARLERVVKRERGDTESTVPAALMLDDRTGYVRIISFSGERTAEDLRQSLRRLDGRGMVRLVLDLRQNGGGLVDEAAAIASEFLPQGAIVYTSQSRRAAPDTGRVRRSMRAQNGIPTIILIDAGTASASELLAGALQDHDRALIVGQPSFGKSLMMRGFPLSDGSILMLVVGQLRTPCGRIIQRQYREITARNYYRLAEAERDTVGRPSCQTKGGRTVYGGGGIYPDVRTAPPPPLAEWQRRVNALDLTLAWVGGYLTQHGATMGTLEAFAARPVLAEGAADTFRAFAQERGVTIPRSADDDARLERTLLLAVASARWGNTGLFTVEARLDPDVRGALQYFEGLGARGIR